MKDIKFKFVYTRPDKYYGPYAASDVKYKFLIVDLNKAEKCWDTVFNTWNVPDDRYIRLIDKLQFTGLKDRNDNDIFEGDICQFWRYETGEWFKSIPLIVVKWNETGLNYNIWKPHNEISQWEVIGNIYENGDLLK